MKSLEDIFTAEELASIDAGTYNVKDLAAKLDYCIALEREACAKVCEDWHFETEDPRDVAAAIRARGEK